MKWNYSDLDKIGRVRLSQHFYMREFLHSEIAQLYGLTNAPEDIDVAIEAGKSLCSQVLEPLQDAWGRLHIRSGYRSAEVNQIGNEKKLNCASNAKNAAAHIWDARDSNGFMGATACIVIPRYQDYYEKTHDWAPLAWWIDLHIPAYFEICFFKEQCAFNIRWYEGDDGRKTIKTYVANPDTGDKSNLITRGNVHPAYADKTPEQRCSTATRLLQTGS